MFRKFDRPDVAHMSLADFVRVVPHNLEDADDLGVLHILEDPNYLVVLDDLVVLGNLGALYI